MVKFTHVKQPNGYTCAPAAVAIVTGDSLDELIAELHPTEKSGTRHALMIRALKRRGVRCGERFESLRGRPLPHTAIIRISYPDKRVGHVVVKHGRTWFDPALDAPFDGEPIMTVSGQRVWIGCARITSSLWLGDGMP